MLRSFGLRVFLVKTAQYSHRRDDRFPSFQSASASPLFAANASTSDTQFSLSHHIPLISVYILRWQILRIACLCWTYSVNLLHLPTLHSRSERGLTTTNLFCGQSFHHTLKRSRSNRVVPTLVFVTGSVTVDSRNGEVKEEARTRKSLKDKALRRDITIRTPSPLLGRYHAHRPVTPAAVEQAADDSYASRRLHRGA